MPRNNAESDQPSKRDSETDPHYLWVVIKMETGHPDRVFDTREEAEEFAGDKLGDELAIGAARYGYAGAGP